MKRRSIAFLLTVALAAVPTLSTSAPPSCQVQPLTDAEAENLAVQKPFLGEIPKEEELLPSADPSAVESGGYMPDVKAGAEAPFGVEIVEPPGCPEISDQ
ncbi:hypothetical protein [Nonomuraea sp. NPDC049750]|uniref:hypothetical protein n=1 Tax=Nonomuraea sp. NPDC049750 TaxID=3154738 RepID=UPI0033FCB22C